MDEKAWIGECAENSKNNQGRKEKLPPLYPYARTSTLTKLKSQCNATE